MSIQMSEYLSDLFLSDIYPYIESKFRSEDTKKHYRTFLNHICDFCKKDFVELTEADVRRYMDAMMNGTLKNANGKPFAKTAISVRLSCLRSIAGSLDESEGLYPIPFDYSSPFKRLTIADTPDIKEERVPTVEDIDRILQFADGQMLALTLLAYRCCLTVAELMHLEKNQFAVDGKGRLFIHITPAVAPERDVKIPDDIRPEIERHLNRIGPDTNFVFTNKRGGPFIEKTLYTTFRKLVVKAGTSSVWSLQDIRNAGIVHLLHSKVNPEEVASFLGVLPKWIKRYDKVVEGLDLQPNELSVVQVKERG